MLLTSIARRWLPPGLVVFLRPVLRRGIYFAGNYPDWETARANASGYDAKRILDAVKQAMLKVKNGAAAYERDSVIFDQVQHSFPVLAGLLRAAADDHNRLSVLDFGGSLGSSYYQCRDFLSILPSLQWSVVEQEHFVRCGQESFAGEELRFFGTIEECVRKAEPNVALLSSVLQYLESPTDILDALEASAVRYIVIDRTPFAQGNSDTITVQHVPPSIYAASYPCWIFGRQRFTERLSAKYEILAEFDSSDEEARAGHRRFGFGGMILRRR